MRKFCALALCLVALVLLQRCSENEPEKSSSTVSFTLSASSSADGRQQAVTIEGSTTVLLSLQTDGGEVVFTHRAVNLLAMGNSFVTEPIELETGRYKITDFLLVNNDNEILYAVPLKDSPLAGFVKRSLPYSFSVAQGRVASVEMEVISIDQQSPEDFGYASFTVSAIKPLQISVFVLEDNKTKLAGATAHLSLNNKVVYTYTLKEKVNQLAFKLDPEQQYTLTIVKDGFVPFHKSFVYNELGGSGVASVQAFLDPAFTMRVYFIPSAERQYELDYFTMGGVEGTVLTVDWGDSTQSTVTLEYSHFPTYVFHDYPSDKAREYFVTFTGPLDAISSIANEPETDYELAAVDTRHLPNLNHLNFHWIGPPSIDVSKNTKLMGFSINYARTSSIKLPQEHQIRNFSIQGTIGLAPSLDYIVDNLHGNAVTNNIKNGQFRYGIDSPQSDPIGPLSEESKAKLYDLALLNWRIDPD